VTRKTRWYSTANRWPHPYTSAGNRFCDLDLWTHDFQKPKQFVSWL